MSVQNLLETLTELLSKDENLVVGGTLNKAKIEDLALKLDVGLLRLLLQNESIKSHFFTDVEGTLVFDKLKFQRFINNKSFLPDSYTAYKNKIGLTSDGQFVSESKEVVLVWPYKDTVLEGEQTTEEQKRDEIFWNETLAPDEIDRLLEPKAFINFRRINSDGEHKVSNFAPAENLVIKGNNLLVLHSLKERYQGKVNLIYLDPPYNTGNGSFRYNDKFRHSSWLTFMKNRLEVAHELLSDTGSIYVQLDYNEVHYAKVLLDEIFGRENFQSQIIWKRTSSRGDTSTFGTNHDTILFYSKTDSFYFKKTFTEYDENYLKRFNHKDERGQFLDRDLTAKGLTGGGYNYSWKGIDGYWRCPESTMRKYDEQGRIYYTNKGTPRLKQYLHEMEGRAVQDIWSDINVINSQSIERVGYRTQKPEKLIQRVLESSTKEGDLILDFFAGSGTTATVAHKMGRHYIIVEQMDYVETVTVNRLRDVIAGEQGGISSDVGWKGGGGFIYFELAQLNQEFALSVLNSNKSNELTRIWERAKEYAFLSYKIDPEMVKTNSKDFKELSLDDQKKFLIELLDKNMLYVNLSEIGDKDFSISPYDKELTFLFYGKSK